MTLLRHLQYAIANARVRTWPFPHIFVRGIFPWAFYDHLDREFATAPMTRFVDSGRVSKAYPATRDVWALNQGHGDLWDELFAAILGSDTFTKTLLNVTFGKWFRGRFPNPHQQPSLTHEVLVTQDHDTFALGPHTDSPPKVATALFYLPVPWEHQSSLGTSIYLPHNESFRCPGGFHHARKDFDLLHTFPYVPNSMFAFWKTDNSFHGVEPVESADPRRLLIYDVRVAKRVG